VIPGGRGSGRYGGEAIYSEVLVEIANGYDVIFI